MQHVDNRSRGLYSCTLAMRVHLVLTSCTGAKYMEYDGIIGSSSFHP